MEIIKFTPAEIVDMYLYPGCGYPIDLPYPGLLAPFDDTIERLDETLWAWDKVSIRRSSVLLWFCPEYLAIVVVDRGDSICLFTFKHCDDFHACLNLFRGGYTL